MMGKKKFSIGEFSSRSGVSVRTLHYYDEIGLLQPEKHPTSGHRIYCEEDVHILQKIISLKFLGYNLDKIKKMVKEPSFSIDLADTLNLHMKALETEKEKMEKSLLAIRRVTTLLEEEGEVDSTVLMSLIGNIQTEKEQMEWMENHLPQNVIDELDNKSEEERLALDKTYIRLAKQLKELYHLPVDDPKVQQFVEVYLQETFQFLGEDLVQTLGEVDVPETEIEKFEQMNPSPFSKEEEEWLNLAIEYYMKQTEMLTEG
ncbi:MerR family transcriptional regulator [Sediminibacillus terrae]|uniref:MerR family transcriptional regulator n=1 Tax=Sediminibacillus terrae TaxID=1562106 RepID=UPI001296CA58|nr:MerR family transcriptional regulator [Sediminibacillus terrae]